MSDADIAWKIKTDWTLVPISSRRYHTGKCGWRGRGRAALWFAKLNLSLCGNCR